MPLFFVHIPKTAGTSFRLGAERYFGRERIVYDYGKDSPATSPLTVETLYEGCKDFWCFKSLCQRKRASMVGGHVNAGRFVSLFGVGQTLTFLRDPLQRMASEYAHFVRHYEYKGSFHDFYSRPIMHNRQSKILHGVDVEAIGFVGLTERYGESLAVLNTRYSIDIPQREDNLGRKRLEAKHEISVEDEAELQRLNKRDIRLYDQAAELFDQRYRLFQEGKPWAHVRLVEVKPQRVAGWAWWAGGSDERVLVEVWVNGKHLETVAAVDLRPGLCRLLPPRGGYVGFHLPVKLKPGDRVQCRVERTGQWFPLKPRRVPKPEA
ncbi:sulfotransferase family 2 domain-containing protein [Halomonas piscis]|uniref:sulfotransferase family 2 domain-containing protein n=1 Tax=Halomonas piscis TaxID=3031727 RepID=UPI00289CE076|nr:sulfotransferase family 2 domain-containing protein [Halomonas piscis]